MALFQLVAAVFFVAITLNVCHGDGSEEAPIITEVESSAELEATRRCPGTTCRQRVCDNCCHCDRVHYAALQVCSCCARNQVCCRARGSAAAWKCCPAGSSCTAHGTCSERRVISSTRSEPYCDKCDPMRLYVTAHNTVAALYVDGVSQSVPHAGDWTGVATIDIPADAGVIAIKGMSQGNRAGMIASVTHDYLVTDRSWKCTKTTYRGWETKDYNDADWPAAQTIATNAPDISPPWQYLPQISRSAWWIWTRKWQGSYPDTPVYCRGRLPKNGCTKSYGTCMNTCRSQNKSCCYCGLVRNGPYGVCSCCPSGYECCPYHPLLSGKPVCCPTGYSCSSHGRTCHRAATPEPHHSTVECGYC